MPSSSVTNNPLILALDVDSLEEAERLVKLLSGVVRNFKVGLRLFTRYGPQAVERVQRAGGRVFLDLKFYDIPNTVAQACESAVRLSVWMMTLHAQGGAAMLRAAREATLEAADRLKVPAPLLLGVTVLTSVGGQVGDQVVDLARLAERSGLDGVVCSPLEIERVRGECGPDFLIVTPGIRIESLPRGSGLAGPSGPGGGSGGAVSPRYNDQIRTATPAEARRWGADYLVIGRPILEGPDPLKSALAILNTL